jgi:hypothetical protein
MKEVADLSSQFLTFGEGVTAFELCKQWRSGVTVLRQGEDLFLLGLEQLKILNKLGDNLLSVNQRFFVDLHDREELPMIMNYYCAESHIKIKRSHQAIIRQKMSDGFSERMAVHVKQTLNVLINEREVDLVTAITKSIIDFHLREFLSINASPKTLETLAFFEDYFTMGLYLGPNELQTYYEAEVFGSLKQSFHEFVYRWKHRSDYREVDHNFLPYDFFYNFSVAGSTNIAKAFIYGLKLLQEQGLDIYDLNGKAVLMELYRFLPLVDNQVVPCFVTRSPTSLGRVLLAEEGYGEIKRDVYIFHAIHHADSTLFELPNIFNPKRWTGHVGSARLMTFGVGAHACCGSRLAETWLLTLFDVWLEGFRLASPLKLLNKPFISKVQSSQQLTSCAQITVH